MKTNRQIYPIPKTDYRKDRRTALRLYVPSGINVGLHLIESRIDSTATLMDISSNGMRLDMRSQQNPLILPHEGKVHWECLDLFGNAKILRIADHVRLILSGDFKALLAKIEATYPTGGFSIRDENGKGIAYLRGELGFELSKHLLALVASKHVQIIDLSNVNELKVAGIGLLLKAIETGLELRGCSKKSWDLLSMTNICTRYCKTCSTGSKYDHPIPDRRQIFAKRA